jgi:rSAM/selenodomain-associated transferase 1
MARPPPTARLEAPEARILIFAKAPVPGVVKTRLIPAIGAVGAAALAAELLEGVVARLGEARLAALELWCAPDREHPVFRALAERWGVSLHDQADGDLGARLYHAARAAFQRANQVLLIGADVPGLDAGYCRLALEALEHQDAVIGPAADGGYVLLGLKRAEPALFCDMPWGGDRVGALTRERLAALGWRYQVLPTLRDLDRPEDLARYRRQTVEQDPRVALSPPTSGNAQSHSGQGDGEFAGRVG